MSSSARTVGARILSTTGGGGGGVPTTRSIIAGAGLTGGGDLSVDRTLDVVANADGSIVVAADDVKVGVLATDAQHGLRGGGTTHAVATALAAGFMSSADAAKLASQSVSNLTLLAALSITGLSNGHLIQVVTLRSFFRLDTTSALTADGITIITASGGVGRWLRLEEADLSWAKQATWFQDSVAGNDENNGTSSGTAIKTFFELQRRWGFGGLIPQDVTVNSLTAIPATDSPTVNVRLSDVTSIIFRGTRTVVQSGTITAVTAMSRGTNVFQSIEASALGGTWTALGLVDKVIRLTSGASVGAWSIVMKDLGGANNGAVTNFTTQATPTSTLVQVTPGMGDTFEVYTLTTLAEAQVQPMALVGLSLISNNIVFEDFDVTTGIRTIDSGQTSTRVNRCTARVTGGQAGTMFIQGCLIKSGSFVVSSQMSFAVINAGVSIGTVDANAGAVIIVGQDHVVKGAGFLRTPTSVSGGQPGLMQVNDVAFLDCTGACIRLEFPRNQLIVTGTIWGTGNATNIISITTATVAATYTILPVAVSTGANVSVIGTTRAWADLPFSDPFNQVTIVPTTPAAPATGDEARIRYVIGTGATQDSVSKLPTGARVLDCWVEITTTYSAGATISFGQAGFLTSFQVTTDNNPQGVSGDIYANPQDTAIPVSNAVVRTTIAGAPAAGAGVVVVEYAIPNV